MNFKNGLFEKFETIEIDGVRMKDMIVYYDVKNIEDKGDFFFEYSIDGSKNLDVISHEIYGDASYYWVLIVCNNIQDPLFDLPLSERELQEYTKFYIENNSEYTIDDYYKVYSLLEEVNNKKRIIRAVRPEKLSRFLTLFKEAL